MDKQQMCINLQIKGKKKGTNGTNLLQYKRNPVNNANDIYYNTSYTTPEQTVIA